MVTTTNNRLTTKTLRRDKWDYNSQDRNAYIETEDKPVEVCLQLSINHISAIINTSTTILSKSAVTNGIRQIKIVGMQYLIQGNKRSILSTILL